MRLMIQPEIFQKFDKPIIGVAIAKDLDNSGDSEELKNLLQEVEAQTRSEFAKFESFSQHPNLAAWRKAYKQFGSDPHQYRCSVESLVRRVLKGDSLPHINKLVNLYNYISLKYVVPVGGEDIDAIEGDMHLAFAEGTEPFVRLNGAENEPPEAGEVVYKDNAGVLCRRWNWREADRTKLAESTKNGIIVIDALAPMNEAMVAVATNELSGLVQKFCGGETKIKIFK